ncbi:MAG: hypothetical protein HY774_06500 [Acidobacteria bacterium]|nr:hypothetical protein [Acidobacteriota bacterium]
MTKTTRMLLALLCGCVVLTAAAMTPIGQFPFHASIKPDTTSQLRVPSPAFPQTQIASGQNLTPDEAVIAAVNRLDAIDTGWRLKNPQHWVTFTAEGITFRPRHGGPEWKWKLSAVGTAQVKTPLVHLQEVMPVTESAEGVAFHRLGITERYLAKARTIEQQFVVLQPLDLGSEDLVIAGQIDCVGAFSQEGKQWIWKTGNGAVTLGDVFVYDADGKELEAHMEVSSNGTKIVVANSGLAAATYPVTIDPEIGTNDFRLSDMGPDGDANFDAVTSAVAYNSTNNEYLVVWSGEDNTSPLVDGEGEIFGQRVSAATGAEIGVNDFRISDMGPNGNANFDAFTPSVAYNSTNNEYLVTWQGDDDTAPLVDEEFEIFGQRLNAATGTEVGTNDFRLSDMGTNGSLFFLAANPSVAYNATNNEYLVVWGGDDDTAPLVDNEFEIFGQRVNAATGAEVGTNDFRLSDLGTNGDINFGGNNPKVAYNSTDNQYLVVWQGDDDTPPLINNEREIFGQRVNAATGAEIGTDTRFSDVGVDGVGSADANQPAVAYNSTNNEYLVVWYGDDATAPLIDNENEVFGQRINAATGAEVGTNDFRLSDMGPDGNSNFNAISPSVIYNSFNNEYLVVWSGDDNTSPLVDNENEIFGQRVNAATGAEIGTDTRLSDMGADGNTTFSASSPATGFNNTNNEYLAVWSGEDVTNDEDEIYGQRFNTTIASTTLTSINTSGTNPLCNGVSGTTVMWNLTFADPVSGLFTGNFTLTDVGNTLTGEGSLSVSGSGTAWTVSANTGTGGGTLRLDMVNSTAVTPAVSNVPFTTGQSFTINAPPTTATVGGPQTICASGITTGLGGNTPTVGTGTWSIDGGGTGTFNPNATTPNATFTHTGGTGPVTVRWTISSPMCTSSSATVAITINQPPTTATVGGPKTICANGTTTGLGGNTPSSGTGNWSVVSGGTGTFNPNATTANATFTHTGGTGPVTVRWTISSSPCTPNSTADVTVTITPGPTTATVGGPQTVCVNGTTLGLGGNVPVVGSGSWSVAGGGTGIFSPNAVTPNATFTHTGGAGPVMVQWTISNGSCTASSAIVMVFITQAPTATAGGPQTICANGTTTGLGGNTPAVGTGSWSVMGGGTGTFSPNATTPNATFSHTGGNGPVTVRWTVTNLPCANATADVVITITPPPTANAGPDLRSCIVNPTVTLGGSIGGGATTGTWSGGTGTFTPNNTTLTATYTPSPAEVTAGSVTLTLTTDNPGGLCGPASDTVTITIGSCLELLVADTSNNRIQGYDGTNWTVIGVGTVGNGSGQFRLPEGVAFDATGRIYVADTGNNRIQWSTDSGATWADFATNGTGTNQVKAPQGLALDADGNLYVADAGNGRVMRFTGGVPGAGFVIATNGAASGQVTKPVGLAIDSTFRLFIADETTSRILRIVNANTTVSGTSATIVATSGTALNKVQNPQGVAIDSTTGILYVADTGNSRIVRWINANPSNSATMALSGINLGQVNRPEGVTVTTFTSGSQAGNRFLIIGDTANSRIVGRPVGTGGWSVIGSPNNIGSGVGQFRAPSKIQ